MKTNFYVLKHFYKNVVKANELCSNYIKYGINNVYLMKINNYFTVCFGVFNTRNEAKNRVRELSGLVPNLKIRGSKI